MDLTNSVSVTYAPEEYADEFPMIGRASPNDWLVKMSDGSTGLDDVSSGGLPRSLEDGETISFEKKSHYGSGILTIGLRGELSVDRPMPPDASLCRWTGESTVGRDIEHVAKNILTTFGGTRRGAGVYDLLYYDRTFEVYRYDAASRRFEPIT